jgi:hypothetical protein
MNKEFKMAYQDLRRELVKQNIPRDEKLKRLLNFKHEYNTNKSEPVTEPVPEPEQVTETEPEQVTEPVPEPEPETVPEPVEDEDEIPY